MRLNYLRLCIQSRISCLFLISTMLSSPINSSANRNTSLDLETVNSLHQQHTEATLSNNRTSSMTTNTTQTAFAAAEKPISNLKSHKEIALTEKVYKEAETARSGPTNNEVSAEAQSIATNMSNAETKTVDDGEIEFFDKSNSNKNGFSDKFKNIAECATELIAFEIITGYVFSAPEKLSSSLRGTLMLTDCLDACRKDVSCHAVNYETGLCVLFSANADELPGALAKSQFPVFTLYAQKSCLSKRPCDRAWYIDRVQDYKLNGYIKRKVEVESRQECLEMCLSELEFECRSANYYRQTKSCELSDMDRITLTGASAFQQHNAVDYLENNCVDEPNKLCEFKRLPGRILKTVDAVHQDVGSIDECRDLCLNALYRCHSYDYADTGDMVCRLSHHSRVTLTDVQEPYLVMPDATTYELSSCYNVTIECGANDMVARIRTSKLFDGKVYAKGSPKSCATDVENSLDFELRMGLQNLECNVHQTKSGRYTNEVVIQHHDTIVTSSDLGLAVTCHYDLANKSLTNQVLLDVKDDFEEPALSEEVIVDSPNVLMKIVGRDGMDVLRTAEVGDPLALKFEILDAQSPYEIFVRELIAMDGSDNAEITLIDANGCPTDQFIMGPIQKSPLSGKILLSYFDAFKFPTSELVQFRALVTPCLPTCEPVRCEQMDIGGDMKMHLSYGRRRRSLDEITFEGTAQIINQQQGQHSRQKQHLSMRHRRATLTTTTTKSIASENTQPSQEDMLLVQSIKITDKFSSKKQQKEQEQQHMPSASEETKKKTLIGGSLAGAEQGKCVNAIGLILAITSFLLAQLFILAIWSYFYQRRRISYESDSLGSNCTYAKQQNDNSSTNGSSLINKYAARSKIYERSIDAYQGRKF